MACFFYDIFYLGTTFRLYNAIFPFLSLILFTRALGLNIGSAMLYDKKYQSNTSGYPIFFITLLVYIFFGAMKKASKWD